jgi:hypothetical protein
MNEESEYVEVLDEEIKGALTDILDIANQLKHFVVDEIRREEENIKNFEKNKDEYIRTISDFNVLESEEVEEFQKKLKQQMDKLKDLSGDLEQ